MKYTVQFAGQHGKEKPDANYSETQIYSTAKDVR